VKVEQGLDMTIVCVYAEKLAMLIAVSHNKNALKLVMFRH